MKSLVAFVLLAAANSAASFHSAPSSSCYPKCRPTCRQHQRHHALTVLSSKSRNNNDKDHEAPTTTAPTTNAAASMNIPSTRRSALLAAMATMNAEAAWRFAVDHATANAASDTPKLLPSNVRQQLESGRAVVIPNWISSQQVQALRNDVKDCFSQGHFEKFAYQKQAAAKDGIDINPYMMKSFSPATKQDGPFVNPSIGNFALRQDLKLQMAQVKAELAQSFDTVHRRPSLANDWPQTHELEYLRYGAGGRLERHVDERHVELKRVGGSHIAKKPKATRRSITWLVYLNDDEWTNADGGQLRLYERAGMPVSQQYAGSNGPDLQVAWLKATQNFPEQPVFLDPMYADATNLQETCRLYILNEKDQSRQYLSSQPFANMALHVPGGDAMARSVMVDDSNAVDAAERLHLIAAPQSRLTQLLAANKDGTGEDGGERIRDILPQAGTLVMFDSVALPHQVLETHQERFAVQGWFHEQLYY